MTGQSRARWGEAGQEEADGSGAVQTADLTGRPRAPTRPKRETMWADSCRRLCCWAETQAGRKAAKRKKEKRKEASFEASVELQCDIQDEHELDRTAPTERANGQKERERNARRMQRGLLQVDKAKGDRGRQDEARLGLGEREGVIEW